MPRQQEAQKTRKAQENCKVCSRVAGAEMRGTSIGAPDPNHWGFTTHASWFIPSHPHPYHGPKSTSQFSCSPFRIINFRARLASESRVQIALCSISSDRVVVSLAGDVGLAILPEGGEGIGFRQVVGGKLQ